MAGTGGRTESSWTEGRKNMPKPVSRLQMAEDRDKEALEHIKKAIEW